MKLNIATIRSTLSRCGAQLRGNVFGLVRVIGVRGLKTRALARVPFVTTRQNWYRSANWIKRGFIEVAVINPKFGELG